MNRLLRVQTDPIQSDSDQNHIRTYFNFSNMNTNIDNAGYEYGLDIKHIQILIGYTNTSMNIFQILN
jgi:hypothetical protein